MYYILKYIRDHKLCFKGHGKKQTPGAQHKMVKRWSKYLLSFIIVVLITLGLCVAQDYIHGKCIKPTYWATTLIFMGVARNKTLGAQLHMIVNMPVKFYDCGCHHFGLKRDTTLGRRDKGKHL